MLLQHVPRTMPRFNSQSPEPWMRHVLLDAAIYNLV